jgi:hypothetical protein
VSKHLSGLYRRPQLTSARSKARRAGVLPYSGSGLGRPPGNGGYSGDRGSWGSTASERRGLGAPRTTFPLHGVAACVATSCTSVFRLKYVCVLDPPREDTRAGRRVTAPRAGGGQSRQGAAHSASAPLGGGRARAAGGPRRRPRAHAHLAPPQVPAAWVSGVFYISLRAR